MKINPFANDFGAEITGVDLKDPSSDVTERIYQAFLDHQMLVIRDQDLTPLEQVEFTERYGTLEWQENVKYAHPDHDKVLILSNEIRPDGTAVGVVDAGDFWHSDSSHHEEPVKVTILMSIRTPSEGGATDFCNMYAVYNALSEATRQKINGRYGIHHASKALNPRVKISENRPGAKEFYARQANERPMVRQPLVRTHDETGRQALYVSPRFTLGIEDMDDAEAQPLLDELFSYITDEECKYHYRHYYRTGDLVLWDNRCIVHRATGGYGRDDIRRLHRTTVVGQRAFYTA
ncbi:MAG: TauD/TfdA family dioxygenase [Marinobacter sp.]|uniref:TauD/TfdA dioxygenase family protein n=1 Tax=Marinobacter sp. TaxID=50741 RepID=UPI0034A06014